MQKVRIRQEIQVLIFMLLLPALVEALDPSRFTFPIQGFPLSLGRLSFFLSGGLAILAAGRSPFRTGTARGLLLIAFGAAVGGLFSSNLAGDFSRAAGFLVLVVGAIGVGLAWNKRWLRVILEGFLVFALVYWTFYVFRVTVGGSGFSSYGELYALSLRGEMDLLNHHIPGIYVSIGTVFVALRYFYHDRSLKLGGYMVFGLGLLSCFLLESRSNFLVTAIILMLVMVREKKTRGRFIFLALPVLAVIYVMLTEVAASNEMIARRFSIEDLDYQQRTTASRIQFLNLSMESIAAYPFGRGLTNVRLATETGTWSVHNQYLTFVVAGGVFALFGVFLWMKDFAGVLRLTLFRKIRGDPPFIVAAVLMLFTFYGTLLTIDVTGLLFFLLISVAVYVSWQLAAEARARRGVSLATVPDVPPATRGRIGR